jgi:hypothetical protein
MRTRTRLYLPALTLTLLALALSGCGDSAIFGDRFTRYEGNEGDGEAAYTFRTMTGRDAWSFEAEAGQPVTLRYALTVEKGTLTVAIRDPEGLVVWLQTFDRNAEGDTGALALEQSGTYEVSVVGVNAGGGFTLAWEVGE